MQDPRTATAREVGRVPATVKVDGVQCPVISAAFLPSRLHHLPAHVVLYDRTPIFTADGLDEPDAPFAVGNLIHDDDAQESRLSDGEYDLTLDEAVEEFYNRLFGVA